MGVMLSPRDNPNITEEEVARAAGLVPGSVEETKFLEMLAVDLARDQASQARQLLFRRISVLRTPEHHSHSSAPFFQA